MAVDQQTMVIHQDQDQVEVQEPVVAEVVLVMIQVMLVQEQPTEVVAVVEDQDLIQEVLVQMVVQV